MNNVVKLLSEDVYLLTTAIFQDGTKWYMGEKWEAFKLPDGTLLDRRYGNDPENLDPRLANIKEAYEAFQNAGWAVEPELASLTGAEFEECFFALHPDQEFVESVKHNWGDLYDVAIKMKDGTSVAVEVDLETNATNIIKSSRKLLDHEMENVESEAFYAAEEQAELDAEEEAA